jgi:hypothetical protein
MGQVSRRELLATGSAAATIATAIVGTTSSVFAQAGQPVVDRWLMDFELAFDFRTLDQGLPQPATAPQVGPVYVAGPIYASGSLNPDGTAKADAKVLGTHRFFGWLFDPAAGMLIGNHTFDFVGRGKFVQNLASDGLSGPISGGTGEFKFARGEMHVDYINRQALAFRAQAVLDPGSVGM